MYKCIHAYHTGSLTSVNLQLAAWWHLGMGGSVWAILRNYVLAVRLPHWIPTEARRHSEMQPKSHHSAHVHKCYLGELASGGWTTTTVRKAPWAPLPHCPLSKGYRQRTTSDHCFWLMLACYSACSRLWASVIPLPSVVKSLITHDARRVHSWGSVWTFWFEKNFIHHKRLAHIMWPLICSRGAAATCICIIVEMIWLFWNFDNRPPASSLGKALSNEDEKDLLFFKSTICLLFYLFLFLQTT